VRGGLWIYLPQGKSLHDLFTELGLHKRSFCVEYGSVQFEKGTLLNEIRRLLFPGPKQEAVLCFIGNQLEVENGYMEIST
jgi:hypothetical protein